MNKKKSRWSATAKYFAGRRKAAMRFYKSNPLMAVELMRQLRDIHTGELRFPDYCQYQFECDIRKKLHVINKKKKKGKRTKPLTFKQQQLARMKRELYTQIRSGEHEPDPKLLRQYNMLLNNPSPYVIMPVTYKGKIITVSVPHSATREKAQALVAHINELCRDPSHSHQELISLIAAYKDKHFSNYAGG